MMRPCACPDDWPEDVHAEGCPRNQSRDSAPTCPECRVEPCYCDTETEFTVPRNPEARRALYDEAGLTDEEIAALEATVAPPEPWWRVERDDCNGRTLACVSCGQPNGGVHHVLCGTAANKVVEARRANP